jgi:hypothetical protein
MNYLTQLISDLNAKPILTDVEKKQLQSLINAYDDYLDNSN